MLTEDQQLDLERTISSWLDTAPPAEDILAYASELPDENSGALYSAARTYLKGLFQRKDNYFTAANCEEFVQDVSVPDQIQALGNFAKFNTSSVLAKLAKTYPSVGSLILPVDIHAWSEAFMRKIEAALSLTTAQEFAEARLYLHSLERSQNPDSLVTIQARLQELFLKEGTAHDSDQIPTREDIDEWKAFYTNLRFLPSEQIEKLAIFEGYLERYDLNVALLDILALLTNPTEGLDLELALWRIEKARVLEELTIDQESRRHALSPQGEATRAVYESLNDIWTEENILNGQTVLATRELLAVNKGKILPIDLADFFKTNLTLKAALDPLSSEATIDNILSAPSPAEAEVYVTQVSSNEGFPLETRTLLKSFLHQITQLIRSSSAQTYASVTPQPAPAV